MEPFVRRSHLIVSVLDEAHVHTSWTHNADAVVLDLADAIPEAAKSRARDAVKAAIPVAGRGGAEVFVRLNQSLAYADIEASAWPGLKGIVFTGVETAAEVEETATTLAEFEKRRGMANGSLHIIVMLDLREAAARAELAALQARINPHFFFNTLNTITSLLDDDPQRAQEVVQSLADLFRYTFKVSGQGPVTLEEELEFTRRYLEIEQARFDERLRVSWNVEPASLRVLVPGLILQPLVENAVAHGIAPVARGGELNISTRLDQGRLQIDVADDGAGLAHDRQGVPQNGHGLGNVHKRLETFYRGQASLELVPNPRGRGTLARIVLPADGGGTHEREGR